CSPLSAPSFVTTIQLRVTGGVITMSRSVAIDSDGAHVRRRDPIETIHFGISPRVCADCRAECLAPATPAIFGAVFMEHFADQNRVGCAIKHFVEANAGGQLRIDSRIAK